MVPLRRKGEPGGEWRGEGSGELVALAERERVWGAREVVVLVCAPDPARGDESGLL